MIPSPPVFHFELIPLSCEPVQLFSYSASWTTTPTSYGSFSGYVCLSSTTQGPSLCKTHRRAPRGWMVLLVHWVCAIGLSSGDCALSSCWFDAWMFIPGLRLHHCSGILKHHWVLPLGGVILDPKHLLDILVLDQPGATWMCWFCHGF